MTRELLNEIENDYWNEKASPIDMAEVFELAIKALEQEPTLLSSELEKNSKLEKIRDQLKSNLRGVEITLEVLAENHPLRLKMEGAKDTLEDCLELIDKAESEE